MIHLLCVFIAVFGTLALMLLGAVMYRFLVDTIYCLSTGVHIDGIAFEILFPLIVMTLCVTGSAGLWWWVI